MTRCSIIFIYLFSVALTGETINTGNAYASSNFYPEIDQLSGYRTKSVLCMAVKDESDKAVAVLQALNKIGIVLLLELQSSDSSLSIGIDSITNIYEKKSTVFYSNSSNRFVAILCL